jgi:hypothetical protein
LLLLPPWPTCLPVYEMIAVVVSGASCVGKRRRAVGLRGQHAQGGPPAKTIGGPYYCQGAP